MACSVNPQSDSYVWDTGGTVAHGAESRSSRKIVPQVQDPGGCCRYPHWSWELRDRRRSGCLFVYMCINKNCGKRTRLRPSSRWFLGLNTFISCPQSESNRTGPRAWTLQEPACRGMDPVTIPTGMSAKQASR
ncbi:hypothetical protein LY78DRAFT_660094 [Colletotrichum sublineola]|nr:hypothetical protein LY78DRAFT_660094 [Colletotrichum sublineola]